MTIKETERLSVLETKVDRVKDDVIEIKGSIKNIEKILTEQNDKFITKKSIVTMITVATGVIIAVIAIANYLAK